MTAGCSLDCIVLDENMMLTGALEIKCPKGTTHVGNLQRDNIDPSYRPQVQGQLYITGARFADWLSYHPGMPPQLIRVERDEALIAALDQHLQTFEAILQEKVEILKRKGAVFPDRQAYMPKRKPEQQKLTKLDYYKTL